MILAYLLTCRLLVSGKSVTNCIFNYSSKNESPKALYRYLLKECGKLPEEPRNYYKFLVRQSFNQHKNENDPERIKQIIKRSYEDCQWVLKKYLSE